MPEPTPASPSDATAPVRFCYLPADAAARLAVYRYHGTDHSLLYRHVWAPLCRYTVNKLPRWLSPNIITLSGLSLVILSYLMLASYMPELEALLPAPPPTPSHKMNDAHTHIRVSSDNNNSGRDYSCHEVPHASSNASFTVDTYHNYYTRPYEGASYRVQSTPVVSVSLNEREDGSEKEDDKDDGQTVRGASHSAEAHNTNTRNTNAPSHSATSPHEPSHRRQSPAAMHETEMVYSDLHSVVHASTTRITLCTGADDRRRVRHMPRIVLLLAALAIVTYQYLDNLDGYQARRIQSASPLGLLIDHGADAVNAILSSLTFATMLSTGPTWKSCLIVLYAIVTFHLHTWQHYMVGSFELPMINGANEGLCIAVGMYLWTAMQWYESRRWGNATLAWWRRCVHIPVSWWRYLMPVHKTRENEESMSPVDVALAVERYVQSALCRSDLQRQHMHSDDDDDYSMQHANSTHRVHDLVGQGYAQKIRGVGEGQKTSVTSMRSLWKAGVRRLLSVECGAGKEGATHTQSPVLQAWLTTRTSTNTDISDELASHLTIDHRRMHRHEEPYMFSEDAYQGGIRWMSRQSWIQRAVLGLYDTCVVMHIAHGHHSSDRNSISEREHLLVGARPDVHNGTHGKHHVSWMSNYTTPVNSSSSSNSNAYSNYATHRSESSYMVHPLSSQGVWTVDSVYFDLTWRYHTVFLLGVMTPLALATWGANFVSVYRALRQREGAARLRQHLRRRSALLERLPFVYALSRLLPMFFVLTSALLWQLWGGMELVHRHTQICCWTVGLLLTKLSIQLMMAHMCMAEYRAFPRTCRALALIACAFVVLYVYRVSVTHTSATDYAASSSSSFSSSLRNNSSQLCNAHSSCRPVRVGDGTTTVTLCLSNITHASLSRMTTPPTRHTSREGSYTSYLSFGEQEVALYLCFVVALVSFVHLIYVGMEEVRGVLNVSLWRVPCARESSDNTTGRRAEDEKKHA